MEELTPYFCYVRPEVAELVPREARRVLDVGCAAGELGRHLKERQGCWVTGIEVVPAAAARARQVLDEVLAGDVEEIVRGRPPEPYDCVVCADVLEHLRDPGAVLRGLRERWLAPGGVVVASAPNVRHWSVIRQLLEGRWDYADAGLLDRTHLRFFTRTTLYFLFAEAGFQITEWRATRQANVGFPAALLGPLGRAGLRVHTLAAEAEDYQYLVVARPRPLAYHHPDGERPAVSVVIPVRDGVEYTRQCLESILAATRTPYEIVVVDNASRDGTPAFLADLAGASWPRGACLGVRVLRNEVNFGFGPACNQGMAAARGEDVVILNNDTVVTDGWLERMRAAAARDGGIGVVGPRSNFVAGPQQVDHVPYAPDDPEGLHRFAAARAAALAGQGFYVPRAIGLCLLIKRAVLDRVGGFDPRFWPGNFEDDDFSLRVLLAGFSIWIADDVFIHHHGSRTFAAQGMDYRALMARNLARLRAKWGVPREAGYAVEEIVARHVFLPEWHYEPLSPAELAALPPPPGGTRPGPGRRYLAFPRWDDPGRPWLALVERYLRSFTARDEVALLLRVDPTGPVGPEEVVWLLHEGARERGLDLEGGPEIVLVDDPLGPLERGRLYRDAHVLAAPELADNPQLVAEARHFGLAVEPLAAAFAPAGPAARA